MNKNWIVKGAHKKLILFFNGWGMDCSTIMHLDSTAYDLIEFNDYATIEFDESAYLDYEEINVVAWSLGVWAAATVLQKGTIKVHKTIAINGTLNPVHPDHGIHPTIFEGTLKGWNEKNRTRFLMRTIGGGKEFASHSSKFGNRNLASQKDELKALYAQIKEGGPMDVKFDTVLIGKQDAIFTPKNQEQYWQGKTCCKALDVPHYPFLPFSNWSEIIEP